ncbi:MAG: GNAT family N-acetyltransferase [Patescibacteria group bacterium]|nr:GNAT family N-acetyltransferase [Patescibacteria group bacterium]
MARKTMIFAALNEAAEKGELLLVDGGMARYHLRKDGWVVIRELIVLPVWRRRGIGKKLVETIIARHRAPVRARCPCDYQANQFWKAMGFNLSVPGKINVWEFQS